MPNQYLKNDAKWDLGAYLGTVQREHNKVVGSIDRFIKMLEEIEEDKNQNELEGEVIATIHIDEKLANDFAKAMNNLQNEVFYNPLFIMVCSFAEFSLAEFCRVLEPYITPSIGSYFKYRKEYGIDKSKNYLQEGLGINISSIKGWNELKTNIKVRHMMIHNAGNIMVDYDKSLEDQPDYKLIKSLKGIDLTETGYLFVEDIEYIKSYQATAVQFVNDVYTEVSKLVTKTK